VQRLGSPHWPPYPAAAFFGRLFDRDAAAGCRAANLGARLIAADLFGVGIDVDCLPVVDVPIQGANSVIGDRAYGETPEKVAILARAVADGLLAGGVLPVLKHIPGHGRAMVDSHSLLPVVKAGRAELEATDFAAFRPLRDLPLAMTAHVVYAAIDPIAPATTSVTVVSDVIRSFVGFQGLLMSDDISMGALSGRIGKRAHAAIAAGCDVVLHCNGNLEEMQEVASAVPMLSGTAAVRAAAALRLRPDRSAGEHIAALRAEWARLIRGAEEVQVARP
jgi:beta-N-acetylhexosaminidase